MSGKMWSGRFTGAADTEFERWQRSFEFDQRLLPQELRASRAYAKGLRMISVLDDSELSQLLAALDVIERDTVYPVEDPESEDVHHFVERQLVSLIGDVGLKLHSGRSRNEQIATDLRLYLRDHAVEMKRGLADLCEALVRQAESAGSAVMPSYTHMQRAEPVLVAHWLLAYFQMAGRDIQRMSDALRRMNQCPLGSGPIAGSTLPLDREFIARELGFDAPAANSMDATSDRDFVLEYANVLAQATLHLSRFSEEICVFASQEYGFVLLPEAYSTGSSAMPQKKNPDAFELIRAKSGRILGCAHGIAITLKGLPLAYNKDLQELQPMLFEACDCALGAVRVASGAIAALTFDFPRMRGAASTGYMNAMAAATYLVGKGVPFRTAHEQVGCAVRYALEKNCELEELALDELRQFLPQADEGLFEALKLDSVLDCHQVFGGTARARVRAAVAGARERLVEFREARYAHT